MSEGEEKCWIAKEAKLKERAGWVHQAMMHRSNNGEKTLLIYQPPSLSCISGKVGGQEYAKCTQNASM